MPLEPDTVFIPVSKGVDVTTEARLVQPPALLEATNSRFPKGGGATKRRGHTAYRLRNSTAIPANTVPVDSAWRLTKILGSTVAWDAAAYSNACITADGSVEFRAYEAVNAAGISLNLAVGLSRTATTVSYTDIEYGFITSISGGPKYQVIESNVLKGSATAWSAGDKFKIVRTGTTVTYYVNDSLVYTSLTASTGTLLVDSSFQTPNANVYNLRVVSGNITQALAWTRTGVWAADAAGWVYGTGQTTSALLADNTDIGTNIQYPESGVTYGIASRDDEALIWDGFSLLSHTPASQTAVGAKTALRTANATMPALRAQPIAKNSRNQPIPDCADNGVIRVVAWIESNKFFYAAYDSVTGATIVPPPSPASAPAFGIGTPSQVRVFSMGSWVHMMVLDSSNNKLSLFSIPESDPSNVSLRSYGEAERLVFDVWKVDETLAVVVRGMNNAMCNVGWISADGTARLDYMSLSLSLLAPGTANIGRISCCIHPLSGNLHIGFLDSAANTVYGATYSPSGYAIGPAISCAASIAPNYHLTVAPRFLLSTANKESYDLYWDEQNPVGATTPATPAYSHLHRRQMSATGTWDATTVTVYGLLIASRAFSVGDRTFLWASHTSALQSTWVLMDRSLASCGTMDFGVAAPDTSSFTASVNFVGQTAASRTKYHLALPYRLRVLTTSATNGVFAEISVKYVTLDFLPKLRGVQAGRSTYFTGAQLWSWDGNALTEGQFLWGPELAIQPTALVGGTLSNPGTYSYRIDVCHKNGQNEEVRSLSILTSSVATTGGNKKMGFYIPTIPTRRSDTYFLVYRNAVVGGLPLTNWWLITSRDPANAAYVANNQAVPHVLFVDDGAVTDTAVQGNELHPATGDNYLQPVACPACEVISAGPDRLWVAGGELPSGVVAPSRLVEPGVAPTFNPYLYVTLDQENQPITAIAPFDDATLVFKQSRIYLQNGPGPNNSSGDSWGGKRLLATGSGAVSQEGVVTTAEGVYYQSLAGLRLASSTGDPVPVGVPVDAQAKSAVVRAAVLFPKDQELRWYCEDRVFVYSYLYQLWSTWDFGVTGAIRGANGAIVTRADGYFWLEGEVYKDGDRLYTHRIRFPWLHAGQLGDFQRVRAISGLGHYSTPHKVHVELFYDDREFPEEYFDWNMPDSISSNLDTWGAGNWGDGVWGNTLGTSGVLMDSTWDFLRQPARQKCSHISISVDDNNTDGAGFVLLGLGLKLARKPGLNRLQWRGGSDNYRG